LKTKESQNAYCSKSPKAHTTTKTLAQELKKMNNEVYSFALKSTLQEIQNIIPDVSNSFIFKDGKTIAKDEITSEKDINQTIDAFDAITEKADIIGGLEAVTIQSSKGRVNIASMSDFYLTTVSSQEADEKYVNTLTRVLIPTIVRLVEKIHPALLEDETLTTVEPEPEPEPVADEVAEDVDEDTENNENEMPAEENETPEHEKEQAEPEVDPEPLLPDAPVTQLIVENIGGLLVPSDTVRIDNEIIAQWSDLYGDKKLREVNVETISGKTTRCKFKPTKNSKHSGKGVIGVPEKIQLTLETSKGELVMVKPVVE
jgi:hypothetical protein